MCKREKIDKIGKGLIYSVLHDKCKNGVEKRNVIFALHEVYIWGTFEQCLNEKLYIELKKVILGMKIGVNMEL